MNKKKVLLSSIVTLVLIIAIVLGLIFKGEAMNQSTQQEGIENMGQPVIPQEGIYEVSNYLFWVPTTAIDVVLKINSNVIYKAHDSSIFRESASLQGSGGIDSIVHNGSNLIEVYFKQLPASMFPEKMRNFIESTEKDASAYIIRNENIYKDGKPYSAKEITEVHIKFQLNKEDKPIITTPEGTLMEKDLKIEPYENGYTKVTANFMLNSAIPKEWEKGMPYDANQHRQLLENAYVELWDILNQEEWGDLRKMYSIVLKEAREQEPLISEATVYSMISPEDGIKEQGLRLMPMHPFSKYELETSNDGKLFRLVMYNDEGVKYSPIVFQNKEGEPEGQISIMPWFSVIDGKVQLTLPF